MVDATTLGRVQSVNRDGIAHISFYHPAHNSLPARLLDELAASIRAASDDPQVVAVVLQSEGDRTFCAGASFEELVKIQDPEAGLIFFSGFANVINACRKCAKFVIARVHGKAVGGGVGLAAAADYTVATQYAQIRLSELAVGIGAFVIGPVVTRRIGVGPFAELSINAGTWRSAEWAREKGLYSYIFDNVADMDAHIADLCAKIKTYNPDAMRRLKSVFWEGTEDWDELLTERAAISGQLVLSEFTAATIAAIKAKADS